MRLRPKMSAVFMAAAMAGGGAPPPPTGVPYALFTHAGPNSVGPSNAATRYGPFANGGNVSSWSATSKNANSPIGVAGSITKLKVAFPVALTQGTYTVTLVVNDVDTALTCTISAGVPIAQSTGSVAVSPGDVVCWKVVPSGTPDAQTAVQISAIIETTGGYPIFSGHNGQTAANFAPLGGLGFGVETLANSVFAAPGVVSRLDVRLPVAPGSGASRTYTLRKNGADTGLTVTFSDTDNTPKVSTGSVAFARGDVASIACTVTGTPVSSIANFGVLFTPTTLGQGLVFTTWAGALSPVADRVGPANGWAANSVATAAQAQNIAPAALTLADIISQVATAPGVGLARNFAAVLNGSTSTLTANINDNATSGGNTSTDLAAAENDLVSILASPSGNPAASSWARVGMVIVLEAA